MKRHILLLLAALLSVPALSVTDSVRVEQLLRVGRQQTAATQLVLYYAERLIGTPYVGQTLEVNPTEQLTVNLSSLDCTTLVENALALALTTQGGSTRFADFKRHLTRIRYRDGVLNGYASRNHYFSEWIASNSRQGIVEEVAGKPNNPRGAFYPFVDAQTLRCTYMSEHPDRYPMLRHDTTAQRLIRANERRINGRTVRYVPKRLLNGNRQQLSCIHDGDILAIVTSKQGLDIAHVGIAAWGKDGRLHLLNASQIHKKVVLEPMTLYEYMRQHPSQLGVRVIRVK